MSFQIAECSDSSESFYTVSDESEPDENINFTMASEGADEPDFVEVLTNQQTVEGQSAKFECVVSGHPQPTVEWLHNRRTISESEEYQIIQDGNK